MRRRRSPKRHQRRSFQVQELESRQLLAAQPLGATGLDLGELLLGTVAVTPVFLESQGSVSTEDWTEDEIDATLRDVSEGVNWWSDLLATITDKHTLDFVIDDTFARNPVPTSVEPINNSSDIFSTFASEFYASQGIEGVKLNRAAQLFNDSQRQELGTDWAFTIFIVDSSEDEDGFFAPGVGTFFGAFAFTYGSFIVSTNSRPVSTIAHEMGHIFQALDEYPGPGNWTDHTGYYNTQNVNAANNPTPGFVQQPSIMRGGDAAGAAFRNLVSAPSSLASVGWQDSDNDGVFDAADVPLGLDVVGHFDPENSQYRFSGSAYAQALRNENPFVRSLKSDITLNRISELQFRIDGGDWQIASSPDEQVVDFNLAIPIAGTFSTIELRAIDTKTGITSPIAMGTATEHAFDDTGVRGFAYVDTNNNGVRDADDLLMSGATLAVTHTDGSDLVSGSIRASDFAEGVVPREIDGVILTVDGAQVSSEVHSGTATQTGSERVFFSKVISTQALVERWDQAAALRADFDQPQSEVTVDGIGINEGSHLRLEAYDADGNIVARSTSDYIPAGESFSVTVNDPLGQISIVRAFGLGFATVGEFSYGAAITELRYGAQTTVTTGTDGSFELPNIAPGDYRLELISDNITHRFDTASIDLQVTDGADPIIVARASKVDSARHNTLLPLDVDGNEDVTPFDALAVINDMSANGSRVLGADELTGNSVDVNNDGSVTPFDALLVINFLGDEANGSVAQTEQISARPQSLSNAWTYTPLRTGDTGDLPSQLVDSTGEGTESESIGVGMPDRPDSSGGKPAAETRQWAVITGKATNSDSFLNNSPTVDLALNELIASFDTVFSEPGAGEAI